MSFMDVPITVSMVSVAGRLYLPEGSSSHVQLLTTVVGQNNNYDVHNNKIILLENLIQLFMFTQVTKNMYLRAYRRIRNL